MFSVVVATRDRVSLLQDALAALADQTVPPTAVVVVDDGSTDGTADWLATVELEGLLTVRTDGVGVADARNRGLDVVETPWVVFLDDDDRPEPTWLEVLGSMTGEGVGIVSCAARYERPSGGHVARPEEQQHPAGRALFLAGAFAARTDLLAEVGGYMSGLTYSENTELSIRLLRACERRGLALCHTDEPLVTIRQPGPRRSEAGRHLAVLRVIEAHPETFDADPDRAARYLSVAGVEAARAGHHRIARQSFTRAFRAKPSVRGAARLAVASVPPLARRVWSRPAASIDRSP